MPVTLTSPVILCPEPALESCSDQLNLPQRVLDKVDGRYPIRHWQDTKETFKRGCALVEQVPINSLRWLTRHV